MIFVMPFVLTFWCSLIVSLGFIVVVGVLFYKVVGVRVTFLILLGICP
jgi:hypothetical protein